MILEVGVIVDRLQTYKKVDDSTRITELNSDEVAKVVEVDPQAGVITGFVARFFVVVIAAVVVGTSVRSGKFSP